MSLVKNDSTLRTEYQGELAPQVKDSNLRHSVSPVGMVETPRPPGEEWGSEVEKVDEPELCRPCRALVAGRDARTQGSRPGLCCRAASRLKMASTEGAKQESPGRESWEQMRSVKKP